MFRVCAVLCLLLVVSACSKNSPGEAPASGTETTGASAAPKPGEPDPPPAAAFVKPVPAELPAVVARINGEDVPRAELQRLIDNYQRQNGGTVPAAERDQFVRDALDYLVGLRLLVQESRARKVAVTDKEVDERLASIRQQFPTEEAFKGALSAQNVTLDQVKAETRQELLVSRLLEAEITPKMAVTPQEIEKVYKENPQVFQMPDRVRASHILIAVPADADGATKSQALARATTVLKSAKAGKDFAALAKQYSDDPGSKERGGDLDFFEPGQMVQPFNDVAFKLQPGAISDVVETQFGYHIIKVTEKQAGRKVPLDEARGDIERRLQMTNRDRHTQEFVNALRQKAKVEILI